MDDAAAERIARLHLALAGGERARWADSQEIQLALWLESRWPGTGAQFAAAYRFHALAARWAVKQDGAAGVVFGAAGFAGAVPLHREALEAAPSARFLYTAVSDETVFVNSSLAGPGVSAALASVRDPEHLMSLPEVTALGVPVQMQLLLGGHWWPADMCRDLTARYAALLPPGSTLVQTLWSPDGTQAGEAFLDMLGAAAGTPAYGHSTEAAAGWITEAGLDLLGAGVADVRAYRRGWAEKAGLAARSPGRVVKAVARKALAADDEAQFRGRLTGRGLPPLGGAARGERLVPDRGQDGRIGAQGVPVLAQGAGEDRVAGVVRGALPQHPEGLGAEVC